jgi:hypothetical protein
MYLVQRSSVVEYCVRSWPQHSYNLFVTFEAVLRLGKSHRTDDLELQQRTRLGLTNLRSFELKADNFGLFDDHVWVGKLK